MVVWPLGNKSPDSNRFTLVTPKPENGVRLQATLGNQNLAGLPVGVVSCDKDIAFSKRSKDMAKILFIIGSMRNASFNRQLAKKAEKLIGERAEVSYLEYADIPYMNQDIEFPAPEAVQRVRDAVKEADGFWIFTPEYNGNIPGVLKNLLDWLSRPLVAGDLSTPVTVGKAITISSVAGKSAGSGVRTILAKLLEMMRTELIMAEGTGFSLSRESFASGKAEFSEENIEALKKQADEFLNRLN